MKRASNIVLLVGQIFGIVMSVVCFLTAIACFVCCSIPEVHQALVELFENNGVDFGGMDAEALVIFLQSMIVTSGIMMLLLGVVCIVDAIVAANTIKEPTKGRLIACIILGVFSTDITIVGGILGLIALGKEERRKALEQE